MKVIFIKDLKKQGKKNEIKEVSDGYATNYLIKNGYAVKYTKSSGDRLEVEIENNKKNEEKNIKEANKIKKKIESEKLSFDVKAGNDGKVFGSISSKQICEKLNELGYNINKKMIKMTKKTFKTITFGCKVNFYETEAVREALERMGYIHTEEDPAIYVLNTCAVTATAERKCLTRIHDIVRDHPNATLVIMGCFSQLSYSKFKEIPQIKIVVGTEGRIDIPANIEKAVSDPDFHYFQIAKNTRTFFYEPLIIQNFYTESRAYVKIQDGCDGFCTFCVIPFVRGKSRCRNRVSILREVQTLVRNNFHEIVITGIDTDCYVDPDNPTYNFVELLKDIDDICGTDCRVRISSIEPTRVSDEFLEFMKNSKSIVPHIHLPLQSGSDQILKAMRRRYDSKLYMDTVRRLKEKIPNLALSTDVIVGFPGESEEDFQNTYDICKEVEFMKIHVFPYSPRPFTPAGKMKNQINGNIAHDRAKRLIALSNEEAEKYKESIKGQERTVLFESKDKNGYWQGYTEDYVPYKIKSDENLKNVFMKVRM